MERGNNWHALAFIVLVCGGVWVLVQPLAKKITNTVDEIAEWNKLPEFEQRRILQEEERQKEIEWMEQQREQQRLSRNK